MTRKTRYLLLLIGFITFLILSPIIVFYVRGVTYDFNKKAFVTTGILAMRLEPKEADIYLNEKLKRQSSGDIKFVVPGEHEVTVKKPGYLPWNKRLNILSGQVTWGSPAFNKIYLIFENPPINILTDKVTDIYSQGNQITYLTDTNLTLASIDTPTEGKNYRLPVVLNTIITADKDLNNLILTDSQTINTGMYLFKKSSGQFYNLEGLFKTQTEFVFSNDRLFALNDKTLYAVDWDKKIKVPIFLDVLSFDFQDNRLYFIQEKIQKQPALFFSEADFSSSQKLLDDLPNFSTIKIFISYQKKIFLLCDNTLYLANSSMEKLAENVSYINFQPQDSALTLIHSGQADYFDLLANNLNYITRSSESIEHLSVKTNIGQAFYISGGKIKSVELDTRDKQNQYVLYNGEAQKFYIDSPAKKIILLDDGVLKNITIR